MKFQELMKKYWFILVLAVLAIGFIVFYAMDAVNNQEKTIQTKQEDGQYVLYSIDGENYTADALYDTLYPIFGFQNAFSNFDRMVVDQAVKTTEEMKTLATNNASYLLSVYDRDKLDSDLRSMGFAGIDELYDYYIYIQKSQALSKEYFSAHKEEYVDPYMSEQDPKMISHILIKVADVEKIENEDGSYTLKANPTEEETTRLNEVLKKLESEDFALVASEYSDDGSAKNGGSLGLVDKKVKDSYVKEFKDALDGLKEGDVTDVVLSEYGYHIIRCDASEVETLLDQPAFISALYNANKNLFATVILEKAEELNIRIENEDLKTRLEEALSTNESEEDK